MYQRKDYINWDEYFMGIAFLSAKRSKDPNTQVGACIVSEDFPWNRESADPYDNKYFYTTHSELNAILNYRGGSLEGSKLYVTLFPCNECAKALIQSGIRTVIYAEDRYASTSSTRASKRMLRAAGVEFYPYEPSGRRIELDL